MNVLGIETSCDETAAAVFSEYGLLSNVIASQAIHRKYGGVVPELASRAHIRLIVPIVQQALQDAGLTLDEIGGIAVTHGPGLVGSILIGLNFAKSIAFSKNITYIGVNHIEGHIFANFVEQTELKPPFIVLIISGGHTQLVYVKNLGEYCTIGRTRDDAAGEAYDKVAKMMDLGYPGGPIIDNLSKNGNDRYIHFPRAMLNDDNFDFSFSGLKTAVLYYLKKHTREEIVQHRDDIVASFQAALSEVLIEKTIRAAINKKVKNIVLAGGVACNSNLRKKMKQHAFEKKMNVYFPVPLLCTDNAAMIACAGRYRLTRGEQSSYNLSPLPSLTL